MKRRICFITGTRADYGIMSRLMKRIADSDSVEMLIIATNMHLSPEFGLTYREIEADGLRISRKIEMLLSSDSPAGTVKSMGLASIGLADAFEELKPDMAVILGDRYEMLAAASAALIFNIPIAHLYGGEITEGAYDDAIRNSITQMASLHFTSTEEYRQRIISMGKPGNRVFHAGSLGVDNLLSLPIMPLNELEKSIGMELGHDFLLVTFHPATKEPGEAATQTANLLRALENMENDRKILFTMPNSDTDGRIVASMIKEWCESRPNLAKAVTSLGRDRYYCALANCAAVAGNSSSGLIEAPSFRKPTLDIGNRQKGRARGNTVVSCQANEADISSGLKTVVSESFRNFVEEHAENPYYRDGTLNLIAEILTKEVNL